MNQEHGVHFPPSFLARMEERLGEEYDAFLRSIREAPPSSIRINPLKGKELFADEEVVPWCEHGRYLVQRPAYVWDPLYHAGCYYAQEASSMLFGNVIDFNRDLKVLDLCAAPGGKSSLLLSFLSPGSILVSNELVGKRVNILYENLVKWGNINSVVTCNRSSDIAQLAGYFDVVLVDAPCSGEGMFRKDGGAVSQWSESLVSQCAAIQKNILSDAYNALAPGGILVYSTCTFEPQENEYNIQWLYEQFGNSLTPSDMHLDPEWNLWPVEIAVRHRLLQKGFYCFPHRLKGEGLFLTALKKSTSIPSFHEKSHIDDSEHHSRVQRKKPRVATSGRGKIKFADKEQIKAIEPFCTLPPGFVLLDVGGEIHVVNEENIHFLETISESLYVRKLGIKCGIIKGKNLIPDHELAMSGFVSSMVPGIEVDLKSALKYQQRNTIQVPASSPIGWVLIRYKGINLGWAKNLGNRMNNHYPAEWRIRKDIRELVE